MSTASIHKQGFDSEFPTVKWDAWTVTFERIVEHLEPSAAPAVVVFVRTCDGFVLADIPGRGWCTPSGRLEPGETHEESALRETYEETGSRLLSVQEFGRYMLRGEDGSVAKIPAFVASVERFDNIPSESESTGIKIVPLPDLPNTYYRWDALIERVFALANDLLPDA